jgi:hypothetical protein
MRVGKGGKDWGGTVGVRNSEEKEGSCCVPCVVCVLPSSLLRPFQHIFCFGFRRRARRNQGLVRVENVANMALGFLASLLSSLNDRSVHILLVPSLFLKAVMEGMEAPQTPQPSRSFKFGDLVHVFNGTCAGTRGYKTVAYMGTVVGYDEQHKKWLVCAVKCQALSVFVVSFSSLPD